MLFNKFLLVVLALHVLLFYEASGQNGKNVAAKIDNDLVGIWKMQEDTDKHNYFVVEKSDEFTFSLTYMNKSGNNRGLEHFTSPYFVVNNEKFIQVKGLNYLVRLLTAEKFRIVAAIVDDDKVFKLSDSDLKTHLASNLQNPSFYRDTVHFRKLFTLNEKIE
ncbi:MAG TPA: hypothetical protein PL009_08935 [Flavipsychrobacter sp.]|nr:hypothetical protein [Flavipsychrobacter sp.]